MAGIQVLNLGGINSKINPLEIKEGDLLRAVNVDSYPLGAKRKRAGYTTFLGTTVGSSVTNLFSWTRDDGTTLFLYRALGTRLEYSVQGTGAWTLAGNGTIPAGAHVGAAVLENTLVVGMEGGSTRHTTDGSTFTNTTLAPQGQYLASKFNRVWIGGTASTLFYSSTGDGTNWSTSGTSDSSSLSIPGPGKINSVFIANNEVQTTKNSGKMFRYNLDELYEVPTTKGPTSPYSLAQAEAVWLYLNDDGFNAYGGIVPQLISNPIQGQVYNDQGLGIAGTSLGAAPGVVHRFNYLAAVGTVTDEFTQEQITDAIDVFNFQANEWSNYQFAHFPTAWHSYRDASGVRQLIFGDASGQCYQRSGTATSDAGSAIYSCIEGFIHGGVPELDKNWNYFSAFFNPGAQARVQVAVCNTFLKGAKPWVDLGDAKNGVVEYRFNSDQGRGKFLFYRIYESGATGRWDCYGLAYDADPIPR